MHSKEGLLCAFLLVHRYVIAAAPSKSEKYGKFIIDNTIAKYAASLLVPVVLFVGSGPNFSFDGMS